MLRFIVASSVHPYQSGESEYLHLRDAGFPARVRHPSTSTPVATIFGRIHLEIATLSPGTDLAPSEATPTTDRDQVTDLLVQLREGDPSAMDRLFPLVYDELRRIAHRHLLGERPAHTLGTTGLVHETYLKVVDQTRVQWRDRGHFFRVASWAMRRVLVDYARTYRTLRRGGGLRPLALDDDISMAERGDTLVALDEALERLTAVDRRLSEVVECRYFGGLTAEETAEALGISTRTVERDWVKARGWLRVELDAH